MSLEEFIKLQELVSIGEEICLDYKNEEYWISQAPNKCYLTRVKNSFTQQFDTPEILFKKGTIDGRLLSEIYTEID